MNELQSLTFIHNTLGPVALPQVYFVSDKHTAEVIELFVGDWSFLAKLVPPFSQLSQSFRSANVKHEDGDIGSAKECRRKAGEPLLSCSVLNSPHSLSNVALSDETHNHIPISEA